MYDGISDAMKNLDTELVISLDPKVVEECDGILFPGGLPDVDPLSMGKRTRAAKIWTGNWMSFSLQLWTLGR